MHAPLMYTLATVIGVAVSTHALQGDANRDTDPGSKNVPSALAFAVLHNGSNSGFTRLSEFVIQDADELTRRWRGVLQGAPDVALPVVDFEKTTVVFVAIGIRNTGGHAVRVDSVIAGSGKKEPGGATVHYTVHYTVTSPGARCMSMQMLTSPIEVISFERVTGVVRFKKRGVSGGCRGLHLAKSDGDRSFQ